MTRWHPLRRDVIGALGAEILHNYGRGRALVAVDGPGGAETTRFADDLAVEVVRSGHAARRARMEQFRVRPGRGGSVEAIYAEGYDYALFRRVLTEPFRRGAGSFETVPAGSGPDAASESAPPDALLIVDGVFLNRPELVGLWNYSVWLDAPDDLAAEDSDPLAAARSRYLAEAHPRRSATAIVDLGDPEHPRRVFADSC